MMNSPNPVNPTSWPRSQDPKLASVSIKSNRCHRIRHDVSQRERLLMNPTTNASKLGFRTLGSMNHSVWFFFENCLFKSSLCAPCCIAPVLLDDVRIFNDRRYKPDCIKQCLHFSEGWSEMHSRCSAQNVRFTDYTLFTQSVYALIWFNVELNESVVRLKPLSVPRCPATMGTSQKKKCFYSKTNASTRVAAFLFYDFNERGCKHQDPNYVPQTRHWLLLNLFFKLQNAHTISQFSQWSITTSCLPLKMSVSPKNDTFSTH